MPHQHLVDLKHVVLQLFPYPAAWKLERFRRFRGIREKDIAIPVRSSGDNIHSPT